MSTNTNKEKLLFWKKWTLINALVLTISYIISLLVMLLIAETIFGFSSDEWGSPFEQIIIGMAAGAIIGISLGITQRMLLRKIFNVSSFWTYSIALGFVLIELIIGIVLWKLDINRGELRFIEGNPLAHSIILAICGLLIGLIQLPLLRRHYSRTVFWVAANILAWGISVLLTAINPENTIVLLVTFLIGTLLYGAITGAALMWVLQKKI